MRVISGLILLACAWTVWAQTGEEPEVSAAKAELARIESLVKAGAMARGKLTQAQESLADAQDAAILRKTAYGQDLDADQADGMMAAAERRVDRREKALDDAKRLVAAGVASGTTLQPLEAELERERKEYALAESRAGLTHELSAMAVAEEALASQLAQSPAEAAGLVEESQGDGSSVYATYAKVAVAYAEHFGKSMPVSAVGETAVHRAMGFDHRGRVDVALNPDQPEGVWLVRYLTENHIPFFAFRQAVPGKATGAHIHIGPASTKLASGG